MAVEALAAGEMTVTQKSYALGLLLVDVVGPEVLQSAVTALDQEIGPDPEPAVRAAARTRAAAPQRLST
ncbi:hypothetical protein AB0C96_08680 [Streptomyces sp. NPDC048506]|uniref:hypothetical protein n=1 Tax=Streptomyces sp. NPDC048506 TaxID=3155028 RepID=UPI00343CD2BC